MAEDARGDADTPDGPDREADDGQEPAGTPSEQIGETSTPRPWPQLRRSEDDRMIAGVAGGLAECLGVSPVAVRIGFIVLALLGGAGALVYLIGWLVLPTESKPSIVSAALRGAASGDASRSRWRSIAAIALTGLGIMVIVRLGGGVSFGFGRGVPDAAVIALVLLAVGAALVLWPGRRRDGEHTGAPAQTHAQAEASAARPSGTHATSPPARATVVRPRRGRSLVGAVSKAALLVFFGVLAILHGSGALEVEVALTLAGALAITGAGVAVSAFTKPAPGLFGIGAVLAVLLLMTSGGRPSWSAGMGTSRVSVDGSSIAAGNSETQIRHGFGRLVVDLSDYPLRNNDRELDIELVAGELKVLLPDNLAATIEADVGTGSVTHSRRDGFIRQRIVRHEGLGVSQRIELHASPDAAAAVDLDIELSIGSIDIVSVPAQNTEATDR